MQCGRTMGQEASVPKPQNESILPTPSPPSSSASAASAVTVVSSESDTVTAAAAAADVPVRVSSTEDAPATVEALIEELQNLRLEVNLRFQGVPKKFLYPQRPDAADCAYYLSTGICGYGANCRFNHPARKKNQIRSSASRESAQEEYTSVTPSPSPLSCASGTPAATSVNTEADTIATAVPGCVSSTEDVPATVSTLEEELQNLGLEDNNKDNGDLKEDNLEEDPLVEVAKPRKILYPQRPDAADCAYYIRSGTRQYGTNCRYNHPARKKNKGQRLASPESAQVKEKEKADLSVNTEQQECKVIKEKEKADLSEKLEQQECKYYLRSGGCKFGKACRYNHSRGKTVLPPLLDFNFLGLPIRPGERECPFYMRTGSCKFGDNCRFHHPDPTAVGGADTTPCSVSLHNSGASQPASTSWSSPSNGTVFMDAGTPYGPMMLPPQWVHQNPEWNGYQVPVCPPERSLLPPSLALNNPTNKTEVSMHYQQHMVDEFPERPGQPDCSYFLKTGDCKYRSACKFNHPKN